MGLVYGTSVNRKSPIGKLGILSIQNMIRSVERLIHESNPIWRSSALRDHRRSVRDWSWVCRLSASASHNAKSRVAAIANPPERIQFALTDTRCRRWSVLRHRSLRITQWPSSKFGAYHLGWRRQGVAFFFFLFPLLSIAFMHDIYEFMPMPLYSS